MSQLSLGDLGGVVLSPDALEEQRGAWCSPVEYTAAAGPFDLDPFTNPRSSLVATHTCMLERADDGFGHIKIPHPKVGKRASSGDPGVYYTTARGCSSCNGSGLDMSDGMITDCGGCGGYRRATADTRVWIQPPYDIVLEALAHYGHTRFTALLRLDTSTVWFEQLHELCEVIMVPKRDRLEFVPPPGVKASSNPFPHGLYYKRASDVTDAVRALCYEWRLR